MYPSGRAASLGPRSVRPSWDRIIWRQQRWNMAYLRDCSGSQEKYRFSDC
jgi:hypothetical protein